jgi:hypothetical protein
MSGGGPAAKVKMRGIMFTSQHYIVIAKVLHKVVDSHGLEAVSISANERIMLAIVNELANRFSQDNPNFLVDKFFAAVYDGEGI